MTNCNVGGKLTLIFCNESRRMANRHAESITMDECWGFQFVPDIKRQSIQWKFLASACPKWMSKSKVKRQSSFTSLTAEEWCNGSMPCLLRLSTKSSLSKFWNVRDRFHRLKPQLFSDKWILHHDNLPSYKVPPSQSFWWKN